METKATIATLLFLMGISHADWSVGIQNDFNNDFSLTEIQTHSASIKHKDDLFVQELELSYIQYTGDQLEQGIYPYSGSVQSLGFSTEGMFQSIWWHSSVSYHSDFSFTATIAKVIETPNAKWTAAFSLGQIITENNALALSLETKQQFLNVEIARKNDAGTWNSTIEWSQWNSNSFSGRSENTDLVTTPTPQTTQFESWWIPQSVKENHWGFYAEAYYADQTTQQLTDTAPEFIYTWVPFAAPRLRFTTALLYVHELPLSNSWSWKNQATLPLFSWQLREWESTRVSDWGTATLSLTTGLSFHYNSLQWSLQAMASSTPWNHMKYIGEDAYWNFTVQNNLNYSF